jgi:hypothetical protein
MKTQEIKTEKETPKIIKQARKQQHSKKNLKYRGGEEEYYRNYEEIEILDEFFTEPNYLEDYLD